MDAWRGNDIICHSRPELDGKQCLPTHFHISYDMSNFSFGQKIRMFSQNITQNEQNFQIKLSTLLD